MQGYVTRSGRIAPLGAVVLLLSGCASTVSLSPAPGATSTGCARVIVGLRNAQMIGTAERRTTDAQGTAAWGTPASVTMYCGVQTPDASALPCFTRDGVDWLRQTADDRQLLVTYGRTPGVQVLVASEASVTDVVDAISSAVADGTQGTDKVCLSGEDATSPSPAPSGSLPTS